MRHYVGKALVARYVETIYQGIIQWQKESSKQIMLQI
jgi:hypothetical protein